MKMDESSEEKVRKIVQEFRKRFPVTPESMMALLNFLVIELILRGGDKLGVLDDFSMCWDYHYKQIEGKGKSEKLDG